MAVDKSGARSYRRAIISGVSGNLMEWYDFAIYAYMVPVLSGLFFPSDNPLTSLIAAFSAFAAGYLARPLGAVWFGYLGDRYGRKLMLVVSVTLMGISTFAIGLLPDYSQLGVAAAVMLVILRILQGISVGGEYTGSLAFVMEHAPPEKRGFATSLICTGAVLGFLIGSGVGTLMMQLFSSEQLESWAWRLPFLSGILIAFVSYLIRRHTTEPPRPFGAATERSPVAVALRHHWRQMLQVMGLALSVNVGFYLMFVYAASHLAAYMPVSAARIMEINTANLLILVALVPLAGWLGDRIGRKPILLIGMLALTVFSYPLFQMMHHTHDAIMFLGQLGFALIIAWIWGASPAAQAEIVPWEVRASSLSIAYNVTLALFGGTAPLVASYLLQRTGDDLLAAWYLAGLSMVSLLTVLTIPAVKLRHAPTLGFSRLL